MQTLAPRKASVLTNKDMVEIRGKIPLTIENQIFKSPIKGYKTKKMDFNDYQGHHYKK
jgi:hypothetical protein